MGCGCEVSRPGLGGSAGAPIWTGPNPVPFANPGGAPGPYDPNTPVDSVADTLGKVFGLDPATVQQAGLLSGLSSLTPGQIFGQVIVPLVVLGIGSYIVYRISARKGD